MKGKIKIKCYLVAIEKSKPQSKVLMKERGRFF